MSLLPKIFPRSAEELREALQLALIRKEAVIGGKLFGPIPEGRIREFFCLNEDTWIWRETWKAGDGQAKTMTTRYEVQLQGIRKWQDGQVYERIPLEEIRNLYYAAELYCQRVKAEYQRMRQTA